MKIRLRRSLQVVDRGSTHMLARVRHAHVLSGRSALHGGRWLRNARVVLNRTQCLARTPHAEQPCRLRHGRDVRQEMMSMLSLSRAVGALAPVCWCPMYKDAGWVRVGAMMHMSTIVAA